jgi:glycosyltransferase involved in cell wall biosynthesis
MLQIAQALPLVSIGIAVWNGEAYLEIAVQSLLDQDYVNLEIIILDNQSTDRTSEICKALAAKDGRIRYILDAQERDVMSAQIHVAYLARGEFYMVACDDDLYLPSYISALMSVLGSHSEVGLAYSSFGFIGPDGTKDIAYPVELINFFDEPSKNFQRYLSRRDPIPMVFGIVRKSLHLDALSYFIRPDDRGWDHDNLYLMRLISQTRIHGIQEILFYYRQQDRKALYKKRNQYFQPNNPILRYLNHVLHQWSVTKAAEVIISHSSFLPSVKRDLKRSNYAAFLNYIRLKYLREFLKDMVKNWI